MKQIYIIFFLLVYIIYPQLSSTLEQSMYPFTSIKLRNGQNILSDFGWRDVSGVSSFHPAIDILKGWLSDIYSECNGLVRFVRGTSLKYIAIVHEEGANPFLNITNERQAYFYLHLFADPNDTITSGTINGDDNTKLVKLYERFFENGITKFQLTVPLEYGIFIKRNNITKCYASRINPLRYYAENLSSSVTVDVEAGDIIGGAGKSGGDIGIHLDLRYGVFLKETGNNYFANVLSFFNDRTKYDYNIYFYTNQADRKPLTWSDTIKYSVYKQSSDQVVNHSRLIALIQSRPNYPAHSDTTTTEGLDLNTVYFRILPFKDKTFTENNAKKTYITANYSGTNENQLLAVFSYKGRGPYDFITNTKVVNFKNGTSVYRFYKSDTDKIEKTRFARPFYDIEKSMYPSSYGSSYGPHPFIHIQKKEDYVHIWTNNMGDGGRAGFDAFVLNTWNPKINTNLNGDGKINSEAKYPDDVPTFFRNRKKVRKERFYSATKTSCFRRCVRSKYSTSCRDYKSIFFVEDMLYV